MKKGQLVLGIDDGPFRFGDKRCALAGVVMRVDGRVERLLASSVAVDGQDAEEAICGLIASVHAENLAAVMLGGVTFGGMNLVRPANIHGTAGIPIIALTRGLPDIDGMKLVVREKLGGDAAKLDALQTLRPISLGEGDLHANLAGIETAEALALVRANTQMGAMPECLRLAHMLATALGGCGERQRE